METTRAKAPVNVLNFAEGRLAGWLAGLRCGPRGEQEARRNSPSPSCTRFALARGGLKSGIGRLWTGRNELPHLLSKHLCHIGRKAIHAPGRAG